MYLISHTLDPFWVWGVTFRALKIKIKGPGSEATYTALKPCMQTHQ